MVIPADAAARQDAEKQVEEIEHRSAMGEPGFGDVAWLCRELRSAWEREDEIVQNCRLLDGVLREQTVADHRREILRSVWQRAYQCGSAPQREAMTRKHGGGDDSNPNRHGAVTPPGQPSAPQRVAETPAQPRCTCGRCPVHDVHQSGGVQHGDEHSSCNRCGHEMIPDAMHDILMCPNPFCVAPPAADTPEREPGPTLREAWEKFLPESERLYRAVIALPHPLGAELAGAVEAYYAELGAFDRSLRTALAQDGAPTYGNVAGTYADRSGKFAADQPQREADAWRRGFLSGMRSERNVRMRRPPGVPPHLTEEQADEVEREMRALEANSEVSKRALRLFMQHPMPCGHAAGNLLTCDSPPFGCVICNRGSHV